MLRGDPLLKVRRTWLILERFSLLADVKWTMLGSQVCDLVWVLWCAFQTIRKVPSELPRALESHRIAH